MRKSEAVLSRHMKTLLYIYDQKGEIYGYMDLAKKLHMGPHTMRHVLRELEFAEVLEKRIGPNNIHIYKLTPKGRRAAELLKQLIEILEG